MPRHCNPYICDAITVQTFHMEPEAQAVYDAFKERLITALKVVQQEYSLFTAGMLAIATATATPTATVHGNAGPLARLCIVEQELYSSPCCHCALCRGCAQGTYQGPCY